MPSGETVALAGWTIYLWLLGWALFPVSSRLLSSLPDRGLAAGRLGLVLTATLLSFWGGTSKFVPLGTAAWWFWLLPLAAATGWRLPAVRERAQEVKLRLLASDAVFLLAWAFFVWVRLKNSAVNDLEKPMDMALIAAGMRTKYLPFENPWFAGQDFTNYYYFGPLMGAMLARSLGTLPWIAYNLIQPAFCAFFLSILWSACTALTGSARWGLAATAMVGLGGHLEPLRQLATGTGWPFDWWATSRVIPNTINEYPAFTLLIGDAHAHFYALSLTALFVALGINLIRSTTWRQRQCALLLMGLPLGVVLLTNTWDAPLLSLLLILWLARSERGSFIRSLPTLGCTFLLGILAAAPYFLRFKSQVSGVQWDPWIPPMAAFLLLWAPWLILAGVAFLKKKPNSEEVSPEEIGTETLFWIGLLALIVPFLVYIRGAFGDGDLRHMDTTFKFGLQAWLLLGTGAACEAFRRLRLWLPHAPLPTRMGTFYGLGMAGLLLALAPVSVLYARTVSYRPIEGGLSLNAMRHLPQGEQKVIASLNFAPRGSILSPTSPDFHPEGARFSTFTGQPAVVGWRDHVIAWGADSSEVLRRTGLTNGFFQSPARDLATLARQLTPTYVVLPGRPEDMTSFDAQDALEQCRAYGTPVFNGGTESKPEYPVLVRFGVITDRP